MRLIYISTYWPEYSGPAVRMRELNEFFNEDVVIFCPLRLKRGFKFEVHKNRKCKEYIFSLRTFYIFDFIIGFIVSLFLPCNKLIHVLGSSPFSHSLFLLTNLRKDLRIIFELVCDDSSPFIKYSKLPFQIKPNKNSTLILPLTNSQNFKGFKTIVKPNPISEKFCQFSEKKLKNNKIKLKGSEICLGYLSKYKIFKNQLFLINVLKNLPENYKLILRGPIQNDYFLKGINNEEYLDVIKQRVIDLNLSSRVDIKTGFEDPINFFKNIDFYVNPSIREGFGTTVIEAIACGLPVVANKDIKAFKDCEKICKKTFYLAGVDNSKKFAEKIMDLSENLSYENLEASRLMIINNYSQKRIMDIYKKAYQMLKK